MYSININHNPISSTPHSSPRSLRFSHPCGSWSPATSHTQRAWKPHDGNTHSVYAFKPTYPQRLSDIKKQKKSQGRMSREHGECVSISDCQSCNKSWISKWLFSRPDSFTAPCSDAIVLRFIPFVLFLLWWHWSKFPWNTYLPDHTVSHPKRQQSSSVRSIFYHIAMFNDEVKTHISRICDAQLCTAPCQYWWQQRGYIQPPSSSSPAGVTALCRA